MGFLCHALTTFSFTQLIDTSVYTPLLPRVILLPTVYMHAHVILFLSFSFLRYIDFFVYVTLLPQHTLMGLPMSHSHNVLFNAILGGWVGKNVCVHPVRVAPMNDPTTWPCPFLYEQWMGLVYRGQKSLMLPSLAAQVRLSETVILEI